MKNFLEEHAMTVVYVVIGLILFSSIGIFTYNNKNIKETVPSGKDETMENLQVNQSEKPVLEIKCSRVRLGTEFKPLDYVVKAEDYKGKNIIDKVTWSNAEEVNTSKEGIYKVQYTLMDDQYMVVRKEVSFLVD